jgi:hypothetical protein
MWRHFCLASGVGLLLGVMIWAGEEKVLAKRGTRPAAKPADAEPFAVGEWSESSGACWDDCSFRRAASWATARRARRRCT